MIAVVSIPAHGHALPLLALALGLARRGHAVALATSAFFCPQLASQDCTHPNLKLVPLSDGVVNDAVARSMLLSGTFMRGTFMLPALHEAFANSHDLRLVISDFSTFAGPHFAEERGLPCVINVPPPEAMYRLTCLTTGTWVFGDGAASWYRCISQSGAKAAFCFHPENAIPLASTRA